MFLLRAAFWLTIVVFLLPDAPQAEGQNKIQRHDISQPAMLSGTDTDRAAQLSVAKAVSFVSTSAHDLGEFCNRNEESCATAASVFADFKQATVLAYQNAASWLTILGKEQLAKTAQVPSGADI